MGTFALDRGERCPGCAASASCNMAGPRVSGRYDPYPQNALAPFKFGPYLHRSSTAAIVQMGTLREPRHSPQASCGLGEGGSFLGRSSI